MSYEKNYYDPPAELSPGVVLFSRPVDTRREEDLKALMISLGLPVPDDIDVFFKQAEATPLSRAAPEPAETFETFEPTSRFMLLSKEAPGVPQVLINLMEVTGYDRISDRQVKLYLGDQPITITHAPGEDVHDRWLRARTQRTRRLKAQAKFGHHLHNIADL